MKKINKNISILFVVAIAMVYCKPTVSEESVSVVSQKIQAGALVVDVRTPAEYANGHYKTAKNIPLNQVQNRISEFGDKSKPVVVYCLSGGRSSSAKSILEKNGYTDVTNGGGLRDMPK